WSGYRAAPGDDGHLSLAAMLRAAADVAGEDHHFRVLQAPLNLAMPEALTLANQRVGDEEVPLLAAAAEGGVAVVASGSLLQARLTRALPAEIRTALGADLATDANRALQFVRSAPGLATALVGMSRTDHVEENLALAQVAPLPPEWYIPSEAPTA